MDRPDAGGADHPDLGDRLGSFVWHDWLDAQVEPQRHQVLGPAALVPSAYAGAAQAALNADERLVALRFNSADKPVVAVGQKPATGPGRPERTNLYLDPRDGSVIDRASAPGTA